MSSLRFAGTSAVSLLRRKFGGYLPILGRACALTLARRSRLPANLSLGQARLGLRLPLAPGADGLGKRGLGPRARAHGGPRHQGRNVDGLYPPGRGFDSATRPERADVAFIFVSSARRRMRATACRAALWVSSRYGRVRRHQRSLSPSPPNRVSTPTVAVIPCVSSWFANRVKVILSTTSNRIAKCSLSRHLIPSPMGKSKSV
jgi:hypothetical protein